MKRVRVAFKEQAKAVVSEATVEYYDVLDSFDNERVVTESEQLIKESIAKAQVLSMNKMR